MVADFTRTDSLKMALAGGLNGDLEPCVRDGCASRTASKYCNTTNATHHVAALDAALPCSATNMVAAAGSSGRSGVGHRHNPIAVYAGLTSVRSRRAFGANGLRAALARRPTSCRGHPSLV